jgi:DNA-binding CsgD family transcriptional regulator
MTDLAIIKNIMGFKVTEWRIIEDIAAGFTNAEIARKLGLKPGTVCGYVRVILQKIGLQHRTQIAILVLQTSGCSASETDGTDDNFDDIESAFAKAKHRYNELYQ